MAERGLHFLALIFDRAYVSFSASSTRQKGGGTAIHEANEAQHAIYRRKSVKNSSISTLKIF